MVGEANLINGGCVIRRRMWLRRGPGSHSNCRKRSGTVLKRKFRVHARWLRSILLPLNHQSLKSDSSLEALR